MTKFLSLLLIVSLALTAYLAMRIESTKEQIDAMHTDIMQVRTEMEDKMKNVSASVDALTGRVAALEQAEHIVPPASAAAPAMTPPAGTAAPVPQAVAPATPAVPATER